MKAKFLFALTFVLSILIFSSCEYVEFNPPVPEIGEENSNVRLETSKGYKSDVGIVYVQKDQSTVLRVKSKLNTKQIDSVSWVIGSSKIKGVEISQKFSTLGEISFTAVVYFKDKATENRKFIVQCVADISIVDPVRVFTSNNNNGTWQVLLLVSKERLKYATDTNYYYNGSITNWEKKIIPYLNKSYVIGTDGKPVVVKSPGKYLGIDLKLSTTGLYSLACVYNQSMWADLSGSSFIRKENAGLTWFYFENGVVTPKGD